MASGCRCLASSSFRPASATWRFARSRSGCRSCAFRDATPAPRCPPDHPPPVGSAQVVTIFTIRELKQAAAEGKIGAGVHVQIEGLTRKDARNGKPFWELTAADAE